jgi:DNA topoisomerase-1
VVRDQESLARIRSLAIPPAWTDVWICPLRNGHLQATGRDARGRKQYRYHPRWRATRDRNKYDRMLAFGRGAACSAVEGVLLDLDGTLIDSNDAHASAWVKALAE